MVPEPEFTPPELDQNIRDNIQIVEGAIVVPPPKDGKNRSVQQMGVLTPDGAIVENSITWRGRSRVNQTPPMPPEGEIVDLKGNYMFLGPLFGHFGHFLVESICRIWAFDQLKDKLDGVLYFPKFQNRPEHVASVYQPLLKELGVDVPMHNLADATRVERLYVPVQGFGMFQMIEGAPEFRDFINQHAGKNIPPEGPEKIYISRSALPPVRGSILGEKLLEDRLKAEGYRVYHPQKHSHLEQIAAYRAATHIISVDCSPLHLLALVGNANQKVGIIARRNGDLDQIFAKQIRAFKGAEANPFNFLIRNWIEKTANRPSRTSWGEVDFAKLYEGLHKAGLITSETPWPALSEDDARAAARAAGDAAETEFRPFEEP